MKRTSRILPIFSAAILLSLTGSLRAQTNSGPASGSPIEPLKVLAVTGDDAGQELDFAAKRAGKPTLYVFVQADKFDRPLARFLAVLDKELSKDRPAVEVIAVW